MYGVPFDNDAFKGEAMQDARRLLADVAHACSAEEASQRAVFGSPPMS
jgi:hypothetical protein